MRVALLQAHHIPEHRRDASGGNYPNIFANMFDRTESIIDIDPYDVTANEYPDSIQDYDCFLITGSSSVSNKRTPTCLGEFKLIFSPATSSILVSISSI